MQAREHERELRQAQQGEIEESNFEIAQEVEAKFNFEKRQTSPPEFATSLPLHEAQNEPINPVMKPRRWYVLDTNLIISCVDILYDDEDETWREPLEFEPSISNAHLIIPQVVFDELDHMKGEATHRGMVARIAFKRLSKLFPNSGRSIGDILNLRYPIRTGWGEQEISILPLHRNFTKCLPFFPEPGDNDGLIALTALEASMIRDGLAIDGTASPEDVLARNNQRKDVILLTNDNPLLTKADDYGVRVKSYNFRRRPVYTGVRELTVPAEMFRRLFNDIPVTEKEFYRFMPDETPLVANEYLIMTPENDEYPRSYFALCEPYSQVARFHKENGKICPLRFVKHEGKEPVNLGIAIYYDALNDDAIKVVNATGDAGTGKTYTAVQHAIHDLKVGKYVKAVVVSTMSAKNPLGALPGGEAQKTAPLVAAIKSAIASYVANTPVLKKWRGDLRKFGATDFKDVSQPRQEEVSAYGKESYSSNSRNDARRTLGSFTGSFDDLDLMGDYAPEDFGEQHSRKTGKKAKRKDYRGQAQNQGGNEKMSYNEFLEKQVDYIFSRYFVCVPYEQIQGMSLEDSIIIIDEAQRLRLDDADTTLARPAKGAKMIVCGDISQLHESTAEKRLQNAMTYSRELYFDWEGAANVYLTENLRGDIARVMTENRRKVRQKLGLI